LVEITIEELKFLLEKGYLKVVKGKIPDLIITGKRKPSKRKKRLIPPNIAEKLKFMK